MINTNTEDNGRRQGKQQEHTHVLEDFTVGERLMAVLFIIMLNNHIYVPGGLLFVSHLD